MKKALIAAALIVVALGGAFLAWQHFQTDPADVAQDFLENIARREFDKVEGLSGTEEALAQAFQKFAGPFALQEIVVTDFAPESSSGREAHFSFTLRYESSEFPPLEVSSNLRLERSGWFEPWQIVLDDNLPLPGYGAQADYGRVRHDPTRGVILEGSGEVLAGWGALVAVGVQPDRITDPDLLVNTLQEQLGLGPEYVRSQYEAPGVQGHWFVQLTTLTEAEFAEVDAVLRPVPGVFFRRVESRAYPQGESAAHLTGYLGEVTASMIDNYPERDYISGELVGRAGLEGSRDDQLRGRPGYSFYAVPSGDSRQYLAEKEMIEGQDLELTIDGRMQELAAQILGERRGALVILDAKTGAVLVLASTPSYDPNEFSRGISSRRWQELSTDLGRPMFNRAIQGLYPPGSVFKVVTVAAAVDLGLVESTTPFEDNGELLVEGNIVRNFQKEVFGEHDLHRAVVDSINTTVAKVGLELGAANLEDYFQRWGLDQSLSLGLAVQKGQIGNPGRSKVALAWTSIGQDQLLLTPLHLAQIFSVFANEGNLPAIHLIKSAEQTEGTPVLKAETVAELNAMLQDVVLRGTGQEAKGTAFQVYGKTGTAEVVGGGVHAWFAGHVTLQPDHPLAFALLVEEGGVGGQTAAPLMRDYLNKLTQ